MKRRQPNHDLSDTNVHTQTGAPSIHSSQSAPSSSMSAGNVLPVASAIAEQQKNKNQTKNKNTTRKKPKKSVKCEYIFSSTDSKMPSAAKGKLIKTIVSMT